MKSIVSVLLYDWLTCLGDPGNSSGTVRICTLCQVNDVENESRALFSYTFYDSFRIQFFDEITGKY